MNRKTYNILEVAGLFYCFAISLVASTGHIVVKIARVILFLAFIMDLAKNKGQKSNDSSYSKWIIVLYIFYGLSCILSVSRSTTIGILSTLLYVVICNIILIYTLNKNQNFVFSLMKATILGSIIHGILLFTRYGPMVYLNSRGGDRKSVV